MTKARIYLLSAAVVLVVIAIIVLRMRSRESSNETRRDSAPIVETEKAERETVRYELSFTGDVLPIQQANIFAKVGGSLDQVVVNMGDPVQAGQLLALIDTTELHETAMQTLATYENSAILFRRTKDLFTRNLASQQDLDNAETAMKVAQAAWQTAKTRLNYASITAPFTGVVTRRYLDPGAVVAANGATLFTIMDLHVVKIFISVLEADIPHIKIGQRALVGVDAFPGREFTGSVTRYSESVDPSTRTMPVEIDVQNKARLLKPGMFASVTVILMEHPDAITVPTQAVLKGGQGYVVFTVRRDTAWSTPVTIGTEQDSRTEILSGLGGDEEIITTGQEFVKNGAPVTVKR
jgi:RND family efflux transporter MFP subunit